MRRARMTMTEFFENVPPESNEEAAMCRIGDMIPIMEARIKRYQELIKLYKIADQAGILVPLIFIKDEYDNPMNHPLDTFTFIIKTAKKIAFDYYECGYKVIPCSVKPKIKKKVKNVYCVSESQRDEAYKLLDSVVAFFPQK